MMKKKKFTVAALALATVVAAGLPTAAAAQDWRRDHDRDGRYERWERREDRQDRREYRQWSRERDRWERQNDRYERQQRREYRRWARGQTIPHHYRSNWYIRDYQRYGYRAPPRGYGYYRTDSGDVVLAALATGVILSLLN